MTAKIFSKDLRLAAHPMMYVFALFGVMLIIPNYPYTVVFFYGLLGIFFTFLNGRENKDVYYCAVLPVTKRDQVRARASQPAIELNDYNLLQERMRELYWEGHRRSDLIRFGQYSGNQYLWSWKGGVQQGQSVPAYREVYAIPTNYTATLGQNPGY